ncbi:MAG: 4-alpha-glucanotransferase [Acidobacteriota bacterium]
MQPGMRFARSCGLLLHPTSLPGSPGSGDLGPAAHRYLDWLASCGVGWWQMLPLNPPGPGFSPYSAPSSFAGSPLLISPEELVADGLLRADEVASRPEFPADRVEWESVAPWRDGLLLAAWRRFAERPAPELEGELLEFRERNAAWLGEYSLFAALKRAHGGARWTEWTEDLSGGIPDALTAWRRRHQDMVRAEEFAQFLFDRQWRAVRQEAARSGVRIIGDVPIFVAHDSADVWAHRRLFQLGPDGHPVAVAGVPPDYFSETGQLWGNPLYDWGAHAASGYSWWIARLARALDLFDAVRLDHFRGFAAYWSIPAGETTARDGRWLAGPGRALFEAAERALGDLPLIAEDLGVITPDVIALRDGLGLPGMAILQFAFGAGAESGFLPHHLRPNQVVYTGTHDNNTTLGWYRDDAGEHERDHVRRYLATDGGEIHWDLIRAALASVAGLAVIPHQDVGGLGSEGRMNTPSVPEGNWRFRLPEWALSDWHRARLAELVDLYGRRGGAGGRV